MTDKKETLDFQQLVGDGSLFASTELVKRTIAVPGHGNAEVYVLEMPDRKLRDILTKAGGYDRAELIAAGIRKPDGKPLLTVEAAAKLKPRMAKVLEQTVIAVAGSDQVELEKSGND